MDLHKEAKETDADLPFVMKILARANDVKNREELLSLMNVEVADLLHHDVMACGYHLLSSDGSYVHNILEHNYPAGYAKALATTDNRADSPLFQRWRTTRQPVLFQSGRDEDKYPAEWSKILEKHGLHNIIGHGVLDVRGKFGSYFVFACLPGEVGSREILLLKLITPHLHLALMQTMVSDKEFGKIGKPNNRKLSTRQQEILQWMHQGKTNKEIALLLSTTEKNVKYHIEQIFVKLGVRSRAQAVSEATLLGLLQ